MPAYRPELLNVDAQLLLIFVDLIWRLRPLRRAIHIDVSESLVTELNKTKFSNYRKIVFVRQKVTSMLVTAYNITFNPLTLKSLRMTRTALLNYTGQFSGDKIGPTNWPEMSAGYNFCRPTCQSDFVADSRPVWTAHNAWSTPPHHSECPFSIHHVRYSIWQRALVTTLRRACAVSRDVREWGQQQQPHILNQLSSFVRLCKSLRYRVRRVNTRRTDLKYKLIHRGSRSSFVRFRLCDSNMKFVRRTFSAYN